ncbi:helix-turn-helix transcriptional regulator [Asticcacaulis sp. BYS171W]|uniref:Helix-turn-helix transcriptional regulator n=1 Tax=Asticcacaulis aquaticus TaxID=2984212 RepID=A0ABT5HQJ4_9CAUL|nr:helix-turn-helix transcriptional regulator [Asticcacaulis aquaticus]MDC7682345.1 helix-turn-helix transcriptional regulator [Asticcacaulis aquaticus]
MPRPASPLRRLRLLKGLKQSHLAELMGVAQTTVSRWESGALDLPEDQWRKAQSLLADSAQDAILKRLVESSTLSLHLIDDRTHDLLAVSASRENRWNAKPGAFLGKTLIGFATPEILAAEASLRDLGWYDDRVTRLEVETGPNHNPVVPIIQSRLIWERVRLSDGRAARLVTTL